MRAKDRQELKSIAAHDEVWQEADGACLAIAFDGLIAFGCDTLISDDDREPIVWPLTRLLTADGNVCPDRLTVIPWRPL